MKRQKSVKPARGRRTRSPQELADLEERSNQGQLGQRSSPIEHQELEVQNWRAGISVKKQTTAILIVSVIGILVTVALEVFKAEFVDARDKTKEVTQQAFSASNNPTGVSAFVTPTQQPTPGSNSVSEPNALSTKPTEPLTSRASEYLVRAESMFHNGNNQGALVACKKALQLDPHNQKALALRQEIQSVVRILAENDKRNN
ncbi:MAG TPA: hypothetical protein VE969_04840 [Pyrinomonadaceae bacterium]|jgi:hypothetical protein|nr:hypothetical protein [Pyrinomonadaceae bacterium]